MGGRDHSCEVCHRGGMNDPDGRCECDPRAVLVAETLIRCEGFEPHPGDIENWIDHATAVVKALDEVDASHREQVADATRLLAAGWYLDAAHKLANPPAVDEVVSRLSGASTDLGARYALAYPAGQALPDERN